MKIYSYDGTKNLSGDRVHQARTALRLSQEQLATKMQLDGVTIEREAISKIETGNRLVTDYELLAFSHVLGVTISWLIGEE